MTEYSPGPESDGSPAKMMGIMVVVALLAAGFFAIAVMIDRKPDPMYDAEDSKHHTQSQLEMTPDLWKSKHPVDDLNAPPLESGPVQPTKPKLPITKPPTPPQTPAPSDSPSRPSSTNPS